MSVVNSTSRITTKHIGDIERACREVNTFIFIRPGTEDTMRLIEQGYATKSMDIHDKSSDWGPQAGFVPCDGAFSKALTGSPNPNLKPVLHGASKAIDLALTGDLANPATNNKIESDNTSRSTDTVRFVKAKNGGAGAKGTIFKLELKSGEWVVSWMNKEAPVPFKVWGYQTAMGIKPVTGDYDLWMVAPHFSRWKEHLEIRGVKDEHGESGATLFTTWLLDKLNQECGRAQNHVFHHGAEAQNYGFTQSLDAQLVMFTPTGDSEMVDMKDMPDVLMDVQNAGYLIYWNKRYAEKDPHLMGKAVNAGVVGGDPSKTAIEALIAEAALVKSHGTPQNFAAPPGTPRGTSNPLSAMFREEKAQALIQKNLLGRGNEVPKIQQIQAFYKGLTAGMNASEEARRTGTFKKLQLVKHIPLDAWYATTGDVKGLELQQKLQRAVVELSEMDYGFKPDEHGHNAPTPGATLSPDPKKFEAWKAKNAALLRELSDHFGSGKAVPMRLDPSGKRSFYSTDLSPSKPGATMLTKEKAEELLGSTFGPLFLKMFQA